MIWMPSVCVPKSTVSALLRTSTNRSISSLSLVRDSSAASSHFIFFAGFLDGVDADEESDNSWVRLKRRRFSLTFKLIKSMFSPTSAMDDDVLV